MERFKTNLRTVGHNIKRKKTLEELLAQSMHSNETDGGGGINNNVNEDGTPTEEGGKKHLKRCLSVFDLIAFGVGGIIGAGIFVLTGVAANEKAGPAIVLSYVVAGFACGLSALCYAEFASRVPCAGSTYSYSYIMVGELVAWIIGWDLTLEYMIASATVSRGWSGYLKSIIEASGNKLPYPLDPIPLASGFSLDLIAFASVIALTLVVAFGMKESARFNNIFVVLKVSIVLFVIVTGAVYTDSSNWTPFAPYGAKGIFNAAAITFFAYLGFDGICNVAEEVRNPQRDIPIGILGSLSISTALYIGVSAVLTLMVPYNQIDINAPLSKAFQNLGLKWAQVIVSVGAFAGLTTAQLGGLISQPRLFYSLSRDGLLPKFFSYIHPKYKTPFYSTLLIGFLSAIIGMFVTIDILSDMVSIGTLLSFTLVSVCVLIKRYPTPNSKHESNAKFPVNHFPVFLQRPIFLSIIICFFALFTSFGYSQDISLIMVIVFGVLGICASSIMFFLVPTDLPKGFMCPLVPFTPVLSIWANMYLMSSLNWGTWVRLIVWLLIGLIIYIFYGYKRSTIGKQREMKELDGDHPEKNNQFLASEGKSENDIEIPFSKDSIPPQKESFDPYGKPISGGGGGGEMNLPLDISNQSVNNMNSSSNKVDNMVNNNNNNNQDENSSTGSGSSIPTDIEDNIPNQNKNKSGINEP
eukprot:gene9095-11146_t